MTTPHKLSKEELVEINILYQIDGQIHPLDAEKLLSHIAAQDIELTQLQCDHEWKEIDASFDHEFGTEQVFYRECQKCGLTGHSSPFSHGDEEI